MHFFYTNHITPSLLVTANYELNISSCDHCYGFSKLNKHF